MRQGNDIIWTIRRRIVSQLRAALRGIDLLLRTNFDIRRGGRWRGRELRIHHWEQAAEDPGSGYCN
jgi:hypothetical protein